jgi:hypothetical protein
MSNCMYVRVCRGVCVCHTLKWVGWGWGNGTKRGSLLVHGYVLRPLLLRYGPSVERHADAARTRATEAATAAAAAIGDRPKDA